jgi:hypothetical protein
MREFKPLRLGRALRNRGGEQHEDGNHESQGEFNFSKVRTRQPVMPVTER